MHPNNRHERKLIDEKKKKKREQDRAGHIRRRLAREQAKLQETESELQRAREYQKLGDLQEQYRRQGSGVPLSDQGSP